MGNAALIENFADENNKTIGEVIFLIVQYLSDDPRIASRSLQAVLKDIGTEDIEEALETIAEDMGVA